MNKSCMSHLCYTCCNLTLFSLETSWQLPLWLISVVTSQQLPPWPCSSNLWVFLYEPHRITSCLCSQNFKIFPLSSETKPSPSAGARRTDMIGLIYSSPLQPTSVSFTLLQTYWPPFFIQCLLLPCACLCLAHLFPKELHDFIPFSFKCLSNATLSVVFYIKFATLSHYSGSPLTFFFYVL